MKAIKEIPIYIAQKHNVKQIDVVQFDTGIQLVFIVHDFTIPSGSSATLYVQKPSGKFVFQSDGITIAGNKITVNLENQAITEHGKIPYQVSITSGTDVVTTFTGLIMVEKSMKDAGATESKTVIKAFDEAVSAHVAEFQTKAEQIVQACIATIPTDYTAMVGKVNESANAVKGYLSGAVVRADDVSNVEHNMKVWVHGKNLLKPEIKDNVDGGAVNQVWQCTGMVADDGKITLTNTATNGVVYARIGTITLKKGKVYRFSRKDSVNVSMCLAWYKDTTITAYDLSGAITPSRDTEIDIALYMDDVNNVGNTSSAYVQMEYGTNATDYEPYIDPSTAVVSRHGNNLLNLDNIAGDISGTYRGWLVNPAKQDISLKLTDKNNGVSLTGIYVGLTQTGIDATGDFRWAVENGVVKTILVSGKHKYVSIFPNNNYTVEQLKKRFNINVIYGTQSKPYVAPVGESYIPDAYGAVVGVASASPEMTVFTNNEKLVVECEYNRDTNKVIEKLSNAIIALGGTI